MATDPDLIYDPGDKSLPSNKRSGVVAGERVMARLEDRLDKRGLLTGTALQAMIESVVPAMQQVVDNASRAGMAKSRDAARASKLLIEIADRFEPMRLELLKAELIAAAQGPSGPVINIAVMGAPGANPAVEYEDR